MHEYNILEYQERGVQDAERGVHGEARAPKLGGQVCVEVWQWGHQWGELDGPIQVERRAIARILFMYNTFLKYTVWVRM